MATGCVYEYLREAHLEQYHPYFIKRELLQCDHLASIQMHDYASLGVVSMADRVRLFKLVNHMKSLHSAGRLCPHGYSRDAAEHTDSKFRTSIQTEQTNFEAEVVPQIQHKPPQHDRERKVSGAPVKQPRRETRYLTKSDESIEFRPGTDSPMFKCRKKLSFSDSDLDDIGDDSVAAPPSNVKSSCNDGEQITQERSAASTTMHEVDFTHSDLQPKKTNEATNQDLQNQMTSYQPYSAVNNMQSVDSAMQHDRPTSGISSDHVGAECVAASKFQSAREERIKSRWDHIIFGTDYEANSGPVSLGAFSNDFAREVLGATSTVESTAYIERAGESNAASNVASTTASQSKPSIMKNSNSQEVTQMISKNTRGANASCLTQESLHNSSRVGSRMVKQSKNGIAMDIIEKGASRSKRGAFAPTPKAATRTQAYLPKNLNKSTISKPSKVKTLVHMAGYDYGVPNSPSLHKSRQSGQENERIKVCIRKRPVNRKEIQRQDPDIIQIEGSNTVFVEENKVAIDLSNFIQEHVFKFDEVFDSNCNNEQLYEYTAKPLVSHLFKGGRSTCFAFGQTGSGKTYTLLGNSRVAGLYQHAGRDIFERLASNGSKTPYSLHISYFEIYCGHLQDLLNKRQRVQVRENARKKVCIAGLMETKINSPTHMKKVVEYGNHFRKTGTTGVNNSSSRSHAVLQMELQSATGRRYGRLSFIDLAGSERAADSVNVNRRSQIEGAGINQSLLALKECIRNLDQENSHTPYRQSKLTHILRDSFTGDSRTCMIANISPTQTACENTLNTLRYAHRVKDLYGNSYSNSSSRVHKSPRASNGAENQCTHTAQASQVTSAKPIPFHPSNIQLSSTPKKTEDSNSNRDAESQVQNHPSIIQDTNESPIRGHHMKKNENSDTSSTNAYLSDINKSNPKITEQQSSKSAEYSPLKYTNKTGQYERSAARPILREVPARSLAEVEIGPNVFADHQIPGYSRSRSQERLKYGQASCSMSTRVTASQQKDENVTGTKDGSSIRSLDRAAEYLMEVSHKVRHTYETVVASSHTNGYPPPNTEDALQGAAAGASAVSLPNTEPKVDVLKRHEHVLSNFDKLLNQASEAVGRSDTFDEHSNGTRPKSENADIQSIHRQTSEHLEQNKNDQLFSHEHTDVLKSRSEPSLHTLLSEIYERQSSAFAERNHSGVFCDMDPPIARPHKSQGQQKEHADARVQQTHRQLYTGSENHSELSKDYAEYAMRHSTSNRCSQPETELKDYRGASASRTLDNKSVLPSPADFLQSLAQMKQLPKHSDNRMTGAPNEYHQNRETLSRLGQNFTTADAAGRPFQEMLGSPSNTRIAGCRDNGRQGYSGEDAINRDVQSNSSNHLDGNANCAEGNSTHEQEGDSGLGASAGFKQISCDGEMSETDTMADVPSIQETKHSRSGKVDSSAKSATPQLTLEQKQHGGSCEAKSSARQNVSGHRKSHQPFVGPQNHLLAAHEDQLSHITDLCKQEMNLLLKVRSGHLSFPTYVKCLQELLSSKADILASLNSQLEMHTQKDFSRT